MSRVDVLTREWNGVTAYYHKKYQGPGKVWGDMYSESSTLAVQLDARGGYSDPRFKLDQPTPRTSVRHWVCGLGSLPSPDLGVL